ncbi:hypothetical protein SAMN05444920_13459 [Nonomuraea solani]|uniref:Uncharacterized protein n=1 Tax=Nonomuraea solani TaxID=1144553 RepID=A0A1H6F2F5_9ACTN|nr:hypothetical protein [Nonomuraea solani]SEH03255.1 hypothetical protein SAMN05444920_13459 [Nonomuraea solani]
MHAAPGTGGVLVTLPATGRETALGPDDVAELRTRLTQVGGRVTVERVPYVESWIPS